MTSAELTEWMVFYELEPFGPLIDDYRAGMVCAITGNIHRGKGKKALQPKDFFPRLEMQARPRAPQSVEEQRASMLQIAKEFGAMTGPPPGVKLKTKRRPKDG